LVVAAGMLAVIAAVGVAAAGALAADDHAVGGDRYEGTTTEGQATVIVVSANGRSITALLTAITDDGRCGNGAEGYPYQILSDRTLKIAASGSFSLSTKGTTALHRSLPVNITGTFRGGKVMGRIAATGRQAHCPAPRHNNNPYVATFSATGTPAAGP
jgi:hypothetical protein